MGGWVSRLAWGLAGMGGGRMTRRCCRGRGRGAAGLSKHCDCKRDPYRDGRLAARRRCRSDGWWEERVCVRGGC